jgi:hypothetical protein
MSDDQTSQLPRWRFKTAMLLAVGADTLQVIVLPLFSEGALSPADDVLDLVAAAILVRLLVGIGNSCQPSPPNLCQESIWFPSGP